jgi:aldose 1-epimerase
MRQPSGEQHELAYGDWRAVVTEVGATLRELAVADRPILWGFTADEMCSYGRGQVLAPWPNRLDEGHYRFAGHDAHVALNEPEHDCAIHGLVRWLPWRLEERSAEWIRLSVMLHPSPAYPFSLVLELGYLLDGEGLSVDVAASNADDEPLPFGIGFHPYFEPGPGGVDAAGLYVPATSRLPLDGRSMPIGGPSPVLSGDAVCAFVGAGRPAAAQPVGAARLDESLSGLVAGGDGRWRARFEPSAGTGGGATEVWADERFRWCQVFTADSLPGPAHRRALAIEPMTCPPNALRSGADLVVLEPGARFEASFGISLS